MNNEKHITVGRLKEIAEYHTGVLQRMADKQGKGPWWIGSETYRIDLARDINQELGALQAINSLIDEADEKVAKEALDE